jgi:ParB/RepB/Spo0J family partition protein
MTTAHLQLIPIADLHESPLNPRQHFDATKLMELAVSMKTHGQFMPALARPNAKGFELAAGHRRYRAAKLAGIATLEVKVLAMTDTEFVEILAIENDEREDVHPLEQAQGYRLLMERAGYDVAKIATRVGRSHDFVHDRLRLLQLIPELRAQFLDNRFLLAHAIILAKLTPEQQQQAMSTKPIHPGMSAQTGGLYRRDLTLDKKLFPYVPTSPSELQEWVNKNCRFEPDAVQLEEDFPETAVLLEAAGETGTKTVYITDGYAVSQGARDVNEKTIPERSWERADGEFDSKTCDRAVVGIYADGDRRGQAIGVCVSKTSCTVHWAAEVAHRKAREAKKAKGGAAASTKRTKAPALKAYTPQQIKAKRTVSIRAAAEAPLEKLIRSAHDKPNDKLVAASRAWALKEAELKGTFSAEQLLVALFAAEAMNSMEWKLRERPQDLAAFGVDQILKAVKVDTCVHCGCSEKNGCSLGRDRNYQTIACKWISKTPFVCSNPVCVKQFEKAGGKVAAAVKDSVAAGEAQLAEGDDEED